MKVINGEEDYLVITNNGQTIRSNVKDVRVCGRNSSGVKIINLKDNEKVVGFTVMPPEEEENAEIEDTSGVQNNESTGVETASEEIAVEEKSEE